MHSSTVTVAVLDARDLKRIEYNTRDFKIEWYSGTGCGGQFRNKHQNSCRLTYLPVGLVVTAQCRSRENSFEEAKTTLLARLNNEQARVLNLSQAVERKNQVGSGERGDKIRTYRLQDNIAKDHRTEKSARTSDIMNGNFDLLW